MERLFSKYPRLAFYAIVVLAFVLASGAGRKWH